MEFIEISIDYIRPASGRWRVYHGDMIINSSANPETEAARALVDAGADMDSRLVVYDHTTGMQRISMRLGDAASF